MKLRKIISLILTIAMVVGVVPIFTTTVEPSSTPPVIERAMLITNNMIEIDWQGHDFIRGAGRSKEFPNAVDNNFQVLLNGNPLGLNSSVPSWYWIQRNWSYLGVTVNQNKTTLRLASNLSTSQMNAIQSGASTLTVRITGGVTASTLTGNTGSGTIPLSQIGVSGASANTTTVYPVIWRPYYDKTIITNAGVPVRASEFVHQRTLELAADMVDIMLSAAPESVLSNLRSSARVVIFGPGEHSHNIPEHRSMFLSVNWNRAEGYGGTTSAASAAGVERWHALTPAQRTARGAGYPSTYRTNYPNEFILIHEFGHGVHNPGFPQSLRAEAQAIYDSARSTRENPAVNNRMKWDNSYAGSTLGEYMATAATIWFDVMAETATWDGTRGPVNHRDELRRYDTPFYNFLARLYPETRFLSEPWATGVANIRSPVFPVEPTEPAGRWAPSVKIKSAMDIANNPAGSGIQTYIPFNAAANATPNVELWWDYDTDNMRWFIEPVDSSEEFFRIVRKMRSDFTLNAQRDNLVLTASGGTAGANITLTQRTANDQAQHWRFDRQADGTFVIVSRAHSTMAITTTNNGASSGTRIVMGSATSSGSRFWNLEVNNNRNDDIPLMSADVPPPQTVTFNFNFTEAGEPVTLTTNASGRITNSSAPSAVREGYTFNGWFTEPTDGTRITLGGTSGHVFTAANTVLYAQWTAVYDCSECQQSPCTCPDDLYISMVHISGNSWLEIRNPTDRAVSTKGLYLFTESEPVCTDDEFGLFKWQMPVFIIPPKEAVRIRMYSNESSGLKRAQTNFDILVVLGGKETVYLADVNENILHYYEVFAN